MEPTDEFRTFGKKLPYQEPAGFFDQISEKTLRQAKIREQNRIKIRTIWRTVAVAASLSSLVLLSYFMLEPEKPGTNQIALTQQPVNQQQTTAPEITKKPKLAQTKKVVNEKEPERVVEKENPDENISDLMADLSDEELQQLAARYEADPIINDSEQ